MPATASVALRAQSLRGPVACVDLETTGGMAAQHRIVEVGIVLLEGGEVVEEWSSLVHPGVRIPPSIAAFTGIDDTMVADAPRFEELGAEVLRRLEGRTLVAHNARFYYGFLRTEFRRLGVRFSAPVLCTVRLSRKLYPEYARHNLDALIERLGLSCAARHRALGDAQVLPALLAVMDRQLGPEMVDGAIVDVMREPRLPAHLPPELADDLPETPGVYLFRDAAGTLLYVGKSRNIRSRVFAHFANPHGRGRDARLAQEVRRVEWIETGGEFGALLLESRLIRELEPSGNRSSRRSLRWTTMHSRTGRRCSGRFAPSRTPGARSRARRARPACAARCSGSSSAKAVASPTSCAGAAAPASGSSRARCTTRACR
jgi:DNA polymerase-3 subunit epsilon